jgi:hypothetical protein
MADSSAERVAKHRLTKKSYDAGYARQPFAGAPEHDLAGWCKGLWQSWADTGLYDLTPKAAIPKMGRK